MHGLFVVLRFQSRRHQQHPEGALSGPNKSCLCGTHVTFQRPVQQQPQTDPYEELKKLTDLYEQGVLTDEEYARLKAECLSRV